MKTAVVTKMDQILMQEISLPELIDAEVLIKVKYTGILVNGHSCSSW